LDPVRAEKMRKSKEKATELDTGKKWYSWLSQGTFYVHGIVYMMVRVAVNVSMSLLPFYL